MSERSDVKDQIARMQAEVERLGVASVNEKKKLCDFLKDKIAKVDSELEKLEAKKAELEADKEEFQDALSKLEGSDDSEKPEEKPEDSAKENEASEKESSEA